MKSHLKIIGFLVIITTFSACCSKKDAQSEIRERRSPVVATPQVTIYKTINDYYHYVPVTLNNERTSLISYPAVQDIYFKGELSYPVRLENGYLLDRRGIGAGSAFLNLTYEEYSRLEKTPSPEEIMEMIMDDDPFSVMYRCGSENNYKNLINELNEIILNGEESKFSKVK